MMIVLLWGTGFCEAYTCISLISALRQREANEIIPTRAEQSSTLNNNENYYGAHRAIDLDLHTHCHTVDSDSAAWLKLTLDRVFCVDKVKWLFDNTTYATWTCTNTDCSSCEGHDYYCRHFTVTVTTSEGVSSEDVIPASGCKYGDSVILQNTDVISVVWAHEIAVIGKQGELTYRYVRYVNCVRYSTRSM